MSAFPEAYVPLFLLAMLQKYWHRGAFFQGEGEEGDSILGDVMHRDYNAPTGEDKFDKEMLPKIMQAGVVSGIYAGGLERVCQVAGERQ